MEAHPGAVKAHPGAMEAPPVAVEAPLLFKNTSKKRQAAGMFFNRETLLTTRSELPDLFF